MVPVSRIYRWAREIGTIGNGAVFGPKEGHFWRFHTTFSMSVAQGLHLLASLFCVRHHRKWPFLGPKNAPFCCRNANLTPIPFRDSISKGVSHPFCLVFTKYWYWALFATLGLKGPNDPCSGQKLSQIYHLLKIITCMKLLFSNCLEDYSYSFQGSVELIWITAIVSLFFVHKPVTENNPHSYFQEFTAITDT